MLLNNANARAAHAKSCIDTHSQVCKNTRVLVETVSVHLKVIRNTLIETLLKVYVTY